MWCKIKDIGEIVTGNTPSKSNAGYYGGNIPFFKPTDLEQGRDTKYARDYLSLLGFEQSRKLPVNTILVTCIGATIGKTGINTVSGSCNQQINAIIPNHGAYFLFIYYVCISNYMQCKIKKHASATTLPILNKGNFENFSFPLPPLAEQQRIVTEIEHWFALIDKIEQNKSDLKAIIKQTKNKLLDIAIHGKLVPQDLNDEPASELLKRINPKAEITCDNAHYTNLPAGWAMCKLSDLCKIENGFAFSSDDYKSQGIPLVRISNITHNTIDITDCAYIEGITDDKFKISKGDLLIAMSGATTGKMGVYPFDETAYLNQRVGNIKILNKSSLYSNYRNTYMQSKVDEILKIAYGGAQPNISASIIGNFDFPLPPYKEQIRIVETVQRIFDQLDVITESL